MPTGTTLPSEKLGPRQRRFARLTVKLFLEIERRGFTWSYGDAFRDPRVHGEQGVKMGYGEALSAHKNKLAVDINLFKDGVYQKDTEDHRQFGEYWCSLDPDCRWGGNFSTKSDGNHYSMIYKGVA